MMFFMPWPIALHWSPFVSRRHVIRTRDKSEEIKQYKTIFPLTRCLPKPEIPLLDHLSLGKRALVGLLLKWTWKCPCSTAIGLCIGERGTCVLQEPSRPQPEVMGAAAAVPGTVPGEGRGHCESTSWLSCLPLPGSTLPLCPS